MIKRGEFQMGGMERIGIRIIAETRKRVNVETSRS
jgi:hypothetical protein